VAESSPILFPTEVIIKKVSKVNNRSVGEISPNLVTLLDVLNRLKVRDTIQFARDWAFRRPK
jgi:hypothetical protein